jgi:hypothetical protein
MTAQEFFKTLTTLHHHLQNNLTNEEIKNIVVENSADLTQDQAKFLGGSFQEFVKYFKTPVELTKTERFMNILCEINVDDFSSQDEFFDLLRSGEISRKKLKTFAVNVEDAKTKFNNQKREINDGTKTI